MSNFRPSIDDDLLQQVLQIKPKYLTSNGFINLLIEIGYKTKLQENKNMQLYIHTKPKELTDNLEEQKEEQKEKINKKEKQQEKVIPEDLKTHTELINNFWKVKKGSKSIQAWKQQITEYRKFVAKYGHNILKEQLEAGILNGTWCSLTVKNYEQYYLKNHKIYSNGEPLTNNHPSQKVYKASDHVLPKTLAELKAESAKYGV